MSRLVYTSGAQCMAIYDRLTFACLDHQQKAQTCNYWVTVQSSHTALTAFHTQKGFLRWLELYQLSIDCTLPPQGQHAFGWINGQYGRVYESAESFEAVNGHPHQVLSNGSYFAGKLSFSHGFAVEHVPHFDGAEMLDYAVARETVNPGYFTRVR